jgi:hypothetical protein
VARARFGNELSALFIEQIDRSASRNADRNPQSCLNVSHARAAFAGGRSAAVRDCNLLRPELSVWRDKLYAFMGRNSVSASDDFRFRPSASSNWGHRSNSNGSIPARRVSMSRGFWAASTGGCRRPPGIGWRQPHSGQLAIAFYRPKNDFDGVGLAGGSTTAPSLKN